MDDGASLEEHDDYTLGRSDAETQRLILQHQIYGPLTRQFLVGAGIGAGMKVLDLGCGAGDVAVLAAELVGPQGQVVAVDMNADILDTARHRVATVGGHVSFHHGELDDLEPGDDFDAVIGRWILMYLPQPADLLRRGAGRLRPGGPAGVPRRRPSQRRSPISPGTVPRAGEALDDTSTRHARTGDRDGAERFATYIEAGLGAPQLRFDAPIGGGPNWPGYAYLAGTLRSLVPFLEQIGAVARGEVDLDTVEDRLREEVVAHNGIQTSPASSAPGRTDA